MHTAFVFPRVAIERISTSRLSSKDKSELWTLVSAFQDTTRAYFFRSLAKHDEVLRFRDKRSRVLVGLAAVDTQHVRKNTILFTSNVVILPAYRGHNLVQRAGAETYLRALVRWPRHKHYWLFDTFSYKSYLLLANNFRDYWPRPEENTPKEIKALMHAFAKKHYGRAWNPKTGVVKKTREKKLHAHVAPIGKKERRHPKIRFFAERNPGHNDGDMLVCIAPLSLANWRNIAKRSLSRLRKKFRRGA